MKTLARRDIIRFAKDVRHKDVIEREQTSENVIMDDLCTRINKEIRGLSFVDVHSHSGDMAQLQCTTA